MKRIIGYIALLLPVFGNPNQPMPLFFGNSKHFIIFAPTIYKVMKPFLHPARAGIPRRLPQKRGATKTTLTN
jgi:hypothetical protein